MPDVELEAPEVDLDDDANAYKRGVAVVVVLITLFGAIVAYLQTVESNLEENAAREAAQFAVTGLGAQVEASAGLATDFQIRTRFDILNGVAANGVQQSRAASPGSVEQQAGQATAARGSAARDALGNASQLVGDEAVDLDTAFANADEAATVARLRQLVAAISADDHGGKADTFVAIITVTAVALFLFGLSLTVEGRARMVLAVPGGFIAVVCIGWAVLNATSDIRTVSERAIRATGEGQRLLAAQDFAGAIDAFDRAIDDSPDFAAAYAGRADARFVEGSPQRDDGGSFISVTSVGGLRGALEDLDRAVDLGADDSFETLAFLGFLHLLDGNPDRAVQVGEEALELNDGNAIAWFNLGLAHTGRGDADAANDAYDTALGLLERNPAPFLRSNVLTGIRNDLKVIRDLDLDASRSEVEDIALELEGRLAAFEASFVDEGCPLESCLAEGEGVSDDAEASGFTFFRIAREVAVDYDTTGVEEGARLSTVWYFRRDSTTPYQQAATSFREQVHVDGQRDFSSAFARFTPLCPLGGDYRVEVWAGDQLLGTAEETMPAGPFGDVFTFEDDPILGIAACVPEGFTTSTVPIEGAEGLQLSREDGLTITAAIVGGTEIEAGLSTDELLDLARDELEVAGIDTDASFEIEVPVRLADGAPFQLIGLGGPFTGGGAMGAISIDTLGVGRFVVVGPGADEETLLEALRLVEFTNLDAAAIPET